jgi:DNA primase
MFGRLVEVCRGLGAGASFAGLVEQLQGEGPDFDALVAEVGAEPETDPDLARTELAGAIRKIRLQALSAESKHLAATNLPIAELEGRLREIAAEQERLQQEAIEENKNRQW